MDKKVYSTDAPSPLSFAQVVHRLNLDGDFQTSVLTSAEGLTIAAYPTDCDNDTTAAIVALLQRVSNAAQSMLGMSDLDEVTIYDRNRGIISKKRGKSGRSPGLPQMQGLRGLSDQVG